MNTSHIHILVFTVAILLVLSSCGQKQPIPESLIDIKEKVAKLDSTLNEMYGWEPQDSTYRRNLDTMLSNTLARIDASFGTEPPTEADYVSRQKSYDEAKETWKEFKRLCVAEKYKIALDFCLYEDPKSKKKNIGDFLVALKHSSQRYAFLSEILFPLMQEYRAESFTLEQQIDLLQFELTMEKATISLHFDNSGYIPKAYPYVINDLGIALADSGRMEEAQALFHDMAEAAYLNTGDVLYANYSGTSFVANLYVREGMKDDAIATWEDFRDYLEANEANYNKDELNRCLRQIQTNINELHGVVIY